MRRIAAVTAAVATVGVGSLWAPGVALGEEVSGEVPDGAVWDAAGGPWDIADEAVVPAGSSLTVEAGALVRLGDGARLAVDGLLVARGTEAAPVRFTGLPGGDGEPARWGSVAFSDTADDAFFEDVDRYAGGSILEGCVLEHGTRALTLAGASPYVHGCAFRDNEAPTTPTLDGGAAIHLSDGASPRIRGCTFEDNTVGLLSYGGAIQAVRSDPPCDPVIQGNTFRRNRSVYGGALTTDLVAGPIVGNLFEDNEAAAVGPGAALTKGGAMSLVSTVSAILDNRVVGNRSGSDGGGIHVCVDCFPHSTPFVCDNVITGNRTAARRGADGSAGLGAAFLRLATGNDIYDNPRGEEGEGDAPADFGWYHSWTEGYPAWVAERDVSGNWWGTTDAAAIDATVFDGHDNATFGKVSWAPAAPGPVAEPRLRVLVTTRKLRYVEPGDPMPVFLTVYNPGPRRALALSVLVQAAGGPPVPWRGPVAPPLAAAEDGTLRIEMPEDAVWFGTLAAPTLGGAGLPSHGWWHVAALDAASGERLDGPHTIRFDVGDGGAP